MDISSIIIGVITWMMNANFIGGSFNIFTTTLFLFWIVYPLNFFRKRVGLFKGLFLSILLSFSLVTLLDEIFYNFELVIIGEQVTFDSYIVRAILVMGTMYFSIRFCHDYGLLGKEKELQISNKLTMFLMSAYVVFLYFLQFQTLHGLTYRDTGVLPFPAWEMYVIGQTGWVFTTIIYISLWHIKYDDSLWNFLNYHNWLKRK